MTSPLLNVGFLTIMQEGTGYLGGYLVTNNWGRPLEFRLSSAVVPNRVQQILYANTLVGYICADLIGKTLIEKAGVAVRLIVTTCEHALDVRLKLDIPVACLVPAEDGANLRAAVRLPNGRGVLVCHDRYAGDVDVVGEILTDLESLDLTEPFNRIREAISEARKTGVTGRAA